MTEQLQGRALDEAVFRAITDGKVGDSVTKQLFADDQPVLFGAYSTDPAHLPEMLAWLRDENLGVPDCHDLNLHADEGGWYGRKTTSWGSEQEREVRAHGATLNEAVARLVLAVAGERAGAPKETP